MWKYLVAAASLLVLLLAARQMTRAQTAPIAPQDPGVYVLSARLRGVLLRGCGRGSAVVSWQRLLPSDVPPAPCEARRRIMDRNLFPRPSCPRTQEIGRARSMARARASKP